MAEHETIQAYPLAWPVARRRTQPGNRKAANFGTVRSEGWGRNRLTVSAAIGRLRDEASAFTKPGKPWVIDLSTMVISTNVRTRADGMPHGNAAEPSDPGVAAYFKLRGKPHCVTCDRWDRVADNIGAIAKHLEAIRGIERWGTADVEALFAGFKSLPPGSSEPIVTPAAMSVTDAAVFVANAGGPAPFGQVMSSADTYKSMYRRAAAKLHPDANAGRTLPEWSTLQNAADVLKRHHKL